MNGMRMLKCSLKCQVASGVLLVVGLSAAAYFMARTDSALAKAPLGKSWPAARQISTEKVDHSAFDSLLKKYVDTDGFVDYANWKNSATDRRALQDYLTQLGRAGTRISASRESQLAFWVNAYNAVTLEGILQVYPTTSIRNHTSKFGGYNIWKDLPLRVGSESFSLNQMEHEILRKMKEPRIHFAIVCASIGCPRLRNEAYTGKRIDEQLADNARDFFHRPQNLRIDNKNRTLHLSSILDWFGDDFGRSQQDRLIYLRPYLPAAAQALTANAGVRVKYLDYNWNLNERPGR